MRGSAPDISPRLEAVITKCLEKSREQRFQTATELRESLVLAHDSPTIPSSERSGSAQSRRMLRLAAIASLFVVIAIVAAVLYRRAHPGFKLTDKDTIVLADFENRTGDAVFDDALNTALTVELQQSPFLNLLSADKIRAALKEMNRPETEKMTPATALEVCR